MYYRTKDGTVDYEFSFEQLDDGTYRAYIEDQPSYRGRNESLAVSHRLKDDDRFYVCWSQPLRTMAEVKQVAALWADLTQEYIRTGVTIDEQVKRTRR